MAPYSTRISLVSREIKTRNCKHETSLILPLFIKWLIHEPNFGQVKTTNTNLPKTNRNIRCKVPNHDLVVPEQYIERL